MSQCQCEVCKTVRQLPEKLNTEQIMSLIYAILINYRLPPIEVLAVIIPEVQNRYAVAKLMPESTQVSRVH